MPRDERPIVSADELRAFAALDIPSVVGLERAEVRAWQAVGGRNLVAGRAEAACDLLEYACFLDVGDPASWELLTAALLTAGRPIEADAAISAALALEPTWQRAALASLCREALGDEEEAERWREEARQLAERGPAALAVLERVFGVEDLP